MHEPVNLNPVQVVVEDCHVERAWILTKILLQMRDSWCKVEQDGVAPCAVPQASTEFMAKVPQHALLPPGLTSFPATQPCDPKPPLPDRASMPVPRPCKSGKDLEKALAIGFGPDGATVQTQSSFLSDREIFRRTVMRGKAQVSFHDVSLRKVEKQDDGTSKKTSVSKKSWEEVMQAGFSKFPVGKLERQGTDKAIAIFATVPDDEPSRLQFHDWLVQACQVSVRQWVDAMTKQQSKAKEADKKRKLPETED